MQWRKNNVFNKWYLKTRHPHAEKTRKNPDKHIKTFTKIISEKKKNHRSKCKTQNHKAPRRNK